MRGLLHHYQDRPVENIKKIVQGKSAKVTKHLASVTYPKVLAFKPETMITNMPRASKSTGARERRSEKKKNTVVGQKKKRKKKLEEYLKENPQKKKRGDSEC